jgi:lysozyme
MKTKLKKIIVVSSLMALVACAQNEGAPVDQYLSERNPASDELPGDPDENELEARVAASRYNAPWSIATTPIVIDAFQGNRIQWDQMAMDDRVVGVIHRSSIGLRADTQYSARRKIARNRGYLWGAYHLGTSSDPIVQADFFLKTIGNDPECLMVLDLEDTNNSSMMNIPNALRFLAYVQGKTGRLPTVYANHSVTEAINRAQANNVLLKKTKLWYARFRSNIPRFPIGVWRTYFLWQFSSEINCSTTGSCLYNVPGTAFDMDVNVFYGTEQALRAQWK